MKRLTNWFVIAATAILPYTAQAYNANWSIIDPAHVPSKDGPRMHPNNFLVYSLNTSYFKDLLFSLGSDPANATIVDLPLPDGSFRSFRVWQTPMMTADLAKKYPGIKTFTGEAVDAPSVTAKLDFTVSGFHAMIFDGEKTAFIDPYSNEVESAIYMCHYKKDEVRPIAERMQCEVGHKGETEIAGEPIQLQRSGLPGIAAKRVVGGYTLRKYRLALSCSHQYAVAVAGPTPTKAQVLSAMTTSMNRVNGVYEREFSITMQFVPNEDTLIFLTAAGDPFNLDNNNAGNLLNDNQTVCDARIGTANYDVGHVFTTGSGGLSNLGVVCDAAQKGMSTTGSANPIGDGFDIDYVAHEMGHEFGGNHSFNNNIDGSCWFNAVNDVAYEPGSGSTIMAYAGICGPDDIQPHSDDYFHAKNLLEIYNATIIGTSCGSSIPVGNLPPALDHFTASYNIPYKTPFELTSPGAVDSVTSTTTYCWEQWNLGDFGASLDNTYFNGPIFRTFNPVSATVRVFPRVDSLLKGVLSYVTTENAKGEKVPDTTRDLLFKLTLRSFHWGTGCFLVPDDSIKIHAVSTGAGNGFQGFKVTSPSTAVNWTGGTAHSVTWNVVGSNAAPVNCDSVNVYVSSDGGHTWPWWVGRFPNNGSANVTMPNIATTSAARIKVKGNNNVFFNINGSNFTITFDPTLPVTDPNNPVPETVPNLAVSNTQQAFEDIKIYPVPADNTLYVEAQSGRTASMILVNNMGQQVWKGDLTGKAGVSVANLPTGVYYLQLVYTDNGQRVVKPVLVK
ncbi:MAG: T9SS type A sorting domain-containing protein [Bacteroidetes bacterium]|nr:T9SS type A sorting domain-containing protein [Bacteroidota bacterium]